MTRAPLMLVRILPALILAWCWWSVADAAAATGPSHPPNIVYIMSDELGYYELSCMGHPHFQTPNIDRLARDGVRFTQALAGSSLCAPTRCCLMTGKHAGHTSVRVNGGGTPLRADEQTIASVLKQSGYATGGFGKWGCGGRGSTGVPEKHGFDIFFGYYDQVHAHSYYTPYLIRNSQEVVLPGNHGGNSGKTYSHYAIMDEAKKFIRTNKDKPFFCYMPITPPHGMFDIPETDPAWQLYKDKPWPLDARRYAAMVNMVDRNVGEIRVLLDELGLTKKTILFFCGDNGGMDYFRDADHPRGFHGPNVNPANHVAFRGQKGNLYEGGLRIPMIVCWPGHVTPHRVSDFLWYFPDVLPTAAELAGATPPRDIDGVSIVPELIGATAAGRKQTPHEYLYFELGQQTAVRTDRWKAVQPRKNKPWELYDLSQDLTEQDDVAAGQPQVLAHLKEIAAVAHQPAVEGTFFDRSLNDKDRQAKWGDTRLPTKASGPVQHLPKQGLLANKAWQIARVSSESKGNRKLAVAAIDGDPRTHWHTEFGRHLAKHPHELVIDLGGAHEIAGVYYLARQDRGWNGAFAKCEFYVGDSADHWTTPVATTTFKKTKKPQEVRWKPVRGQYVRVRVLSEVNGGPWASAAEIGVIGK